MSPLGKLLITHCDENLVVDVYTILQQIPANELGTHAQSLQLLVGRIKTTAILLGLSIRSLP